ncbi:MAG TPA: M48 family metalloprotease [Solirubrobacteraceae bacterium]|nr:M48 family metalloprotease [Solirubrobacteraceae bacterium]
MNEARISTTARGLASQSPGIVLYTVTLAGQLFAAIARALIASVVLEIVGLLTGWTIPVNAISLAVGFAPLAVSLLSVLCPPLVAPIDGRWWEMSQGGRAPEQDEREAFQRAFNELQAVDPTLRPPRHWFVAEEPACNASAYASSLCVNRGLLESPYAAAVIAHEMGHLRSSDTHLTSALSLLLIRPMTTPGLYPLWSLPFRCLGWVASGQAVFWFTGNTWEMYWRTREFAADEYAARLGQAHALAQSLTRESLPHERPIPHMRFSRATHPYTKPRIARLQAHPTPPPGEH